MLVQPFDGIRELGLTELVGVDEKVDQNDYSGSVDVDVSPGPQPASGTFLAFAFYQTEDSGGDILSVDGILYILDADPAVSSGDTALAATEWPTVLGTVAVAAADWSADAAGGVAYITDTEVPFHAVSTLYFVFKLTSATSINSDAGDDEQLEFNAWYRRES